MYLTLYSVKYEKNGFSALADYKTTGKRFTLTANTKWTDPYAVFNLRLMYIFLPFKNVRHLERIQISAGGYIENVFCEKYEVMSGYPQPERNFSATLKISYK
jgi:outer membrane cobalamin receptor